MPNSSTPSTASSAPIIGIGPAEAGIIGDLLTCEKNVDYVCFAGGAHGRSLEMHTPDRHGPPMPYMGFIKTLRERLNGVPLMALGRITDPAEADGILARGEASLIALGRPLVADPAWPRKAAEGRTWDIRYCLSCNICWGGDHHDACADRLREQSDGQPLGRG
jgi:dimethylglycine catabolism A